MNIFVKDISVLEYYSKYLEKKKNSKNVKKTDLLDEIFNKLDYKLTFEMKHKSIIQHFLMENNLAFSIPNDGKTIIELINVVSNKFFLGKKIYENYADLKIDESNNNVDFTIYDHNYLAFSEKLASKLLEYTNIKMIYDGPVYHNLNKSSSRKNRVFYINEK